MRIVNTSKLLLISIVLSVQFDSTVSISPLPLQGSVAMESQQPMSHRGSGGKTRDSLLLLGTPRNAQPEANKPFDWANEAVEEQSVVSFPRKRLVDELGEVVKAANEVHNVVEGGQNVVANVASSFRPWQALAPERPASSGVASSSVTSTSGRREPAMRKIAQFIDKNRVEPTLRPLEGKQPKLPKQQRPKAPQDGTKRGRGRPRVIKEASGPKRKPGRPKKPPKDPNAPVNRPSVRPTVTVPPASSIQDQPIRLPKEKKVKRPRGRPLGSQSSEGTKKPGPSKGKQYARKPGWEAGFDRPFFWNAPGPKIGYKRPEGAGKTGPKVGSKGWRAGIGKKPHWKKSGPKPVQQKEASPELPPFPEPTFKRPARWDRPFPDWIKKHKPNGDGAGPSGEAASVSKRG